jgi:RNA polymerase sigma factor (sigma-70 family)
MEKEPAYPNVHQELIDLCRQGNREAQFRIYGLYYKAMFNTSFRIVKNPGEAEDIMQESFMSAFDKIDSYSGKVSFGAWLKKIVVNRSLDRMRQRKMYFETLDERMAEDLSDERSGEETESLEEIATNVAKIRKAILQLPDGFRIVLSLHLLEGYDHDEIAKILNVSASTSRSQYARARQKLVEILKRNE